MVGQTTADFFDSEAETRVETFVSETSNGSRKKARQAWRTSHELLSMPRTSVRWSTLIYRVQY